MRMDHRRLPLTALRTFESAGRLSSFSRAADELLVTQAAVSRQIRDLERYLGMPLFERHHRRVILTAEGARMLPLVTKGLDTLGTAVREAHATHPATVLTISAEPGFAARWLVDHLDEFRAVHPQVDIEVVSDQRLIDFRTSRVELSIRFSPTAPDWPRVEILHLAECIATPVVAPFLEAKFPLQGPEDLAIYTLLHEDGREFWSIWMQQAGISSIDIARGPLYNDHALVMAAAVRGHGVALGDLLLIQEDIAAGRLIAPFDLHVSFGNYWLVAPSFEKISPTAKIFSAWLQRELETRR
jgi:LysR family glycine cleavage system transcriptional activator